MDNHFDRRERTIYVWMLERNVTDDQLYALFSKIGPIEKLIFKEYADGTPQHCLIVFRYVDSVLTAMSTLQGAELNGKPISLRPLRESTHAVLMPASTMYPTASSSKERRRTTVTSTDGLSEHSDDRKVRPSWDAASSTGSASSCIWSPSSGGDGGLDSAIEKLAIDERRGGGGSNQGGSRSCASYSSISSGGLASPSHHSLSPPPQQSQLQPMQQQQLPYASSAIHGSLRKPWRPSRGPIPAPLLTPGGFPRHQLQQQHAYPKEEYGSGGGGGYGSHAHHSAGLAPPPSLFSQIIPPSPGYGGVCSPSPYTGGHAAPHSSSSFFGGGGGGATASSAFSSPRPLFPELYKPATRGPQAPTGVFSPTAAPEEVLWRAQPPPLMSPPCTGGGAAAGGTNWFDYGEYSVPQAYRGSGSEQQFAAAASAAAAEAGQTPLSLGGMLPPNSPPIGQCTRFFDFSSSAGAATLPHRLRHSAAPPAHFGPSPHNHYRAPPPHSARPHAASPWAMGGTGGARCAPRAPRSAAPMQHSAFAWPAEFAGRF